MGYQIKKIIQCFKKYEIDIAISKAPTVFDQDKNTNSEETPILQKSVMYKLKCKDCDKVYIGETGRKFVVRLKEHARGKCERVTGPLIHCTLGTLWKHGINSINKKM